MLSDVWTVPGSCFVSGTVTITATSGASVPVSRVSGSLSDTALGLVILRIALEAIVCTNRLTMCAMVCRSARNHLLSLRRRGPGGTVMPPGYASVAGPTPAHWFACVMLVNHEVLPAGMNCIRSLYAGGTDLIAVLSEYKYPSWIGDLNRGSALEGEAAIHRQRDVPPSYSVDTIRPMLSHIERSIICDRTTM